jgi:glycine/D-amino acid oxidase-like deaminating enzyme
MAGVRLQDGTTLTADRYVFACGPWLGRVFPDVVGARVQPTRQEVFYFGTPPGDIRFDEGRFPVWADMSEQVWYGIPGSESRGFKISLDNRGPAFDPTSGERTPSPDMIEAARAYLAHRFPALAGAPLLAAEVCQYEQSPDGDLIVDRHPEARNVWLVGGGSGHGYKLGPAVGAHAAERVLEEQPVEPRFRLGRFDE